jgi:radical SAM protein with 4Fe4S-binding SPASM domain
MHLSHDCAMACRYCYQSKAESKSKVQKNRPDLHCNKKMPISMAKKFIDNILDEYDWLHFEGTLEEQKLNSLVLHPSGGDALSDIDLLIEMTEYLESVWPKKHCYYPSWRYKIVTNGLYFDNPKVREFCEKYKNEDHLTLALSIDGCPTVQNYNRPLQDGSDSWNKIKSQIKWIKKMHVQTSSVWLPQNIPYLLESAKFLIKNFDLGSFNGFFANEVDIVYTPHDIKILIEQFEKVYKYCKLVGTLTNLCGYDYLVNLTDRQHQLTSYDVCGWGCKPVCDLDGNYYPCVRLMIDPIGNVNTGIEYNKLHEIRRNGYLKNLKQPKKCDTCPIWSSCWTCVAYCLEVNHGERSVSTCWVEKARVYVSLKVQKKLTPEQTNLMLALKKELDDYTG